MRLEEDGKTVNGQGADTDTLVAAAHAYVNALNKLLVKRAKTAPEATVALDENGTRPTHAGAGLIGRCALSGLWPDQGLAD